MFRQQKMRDIGDNYPHPVMMGHGFNNFRDSNYIGPSDVPILEALFQIGMEKGSNRMGVIEMEEDFENNLQSLLVPNYHAITAWLYARL